MVQAIRPAGAEDGHIVDMLGDFGIPVGNPDAALAVLLPVALVGMSVLLAVPMAVTTLPNEAGMGWPASFSRARLGIEEVEVAGTAFHEEPDHAIWRSA